MPAKSKRTAKMQWFLMDLHVHTPASTDFQEPVEVGYLDVLRKAEARGLDIVAFADHNTVNGYRAMMDEIDRLRFLEELGRAQPEERRRLAEYRRLLDKMLVLPGFEFTATFGFHILGIFSPRTSIRQIEHILLSLNVPPDALDEGSSNVGASADVLTAYRTINLAGGIVIAAHANSTHGVAMKGFDFGGQTRIAYTQDPFLHALEVTDLDRSGRGTTARFFDGTKPEYPRRMRCIQSSDAHRINAEPGVGKNLNLGVGDRATEVLLPERTFEALLEMFRSNDFARTRPYAMNRAPVDHIQAAREEGPSIVQAFQERATRRGGMLYAIVADVCAMANTNGGTIYVGLGVDAKQKPIGVDTPAEVIEMLNSEIEEKLTPPLDVEIDTQQTQGKIVVRIQVPKGDDPPYALDDNKIYVRDEAETTLAVRDEIVRLVMGSREATAAPVMPQLAPTAPSLPEAAPTEIEIKSESNGGGGIPAPKTGVEVLGTEIRKGTPYHMMRDLRNGNIVKNVTRSSARRLWHYAITETEKNPVDAKQVVWKNNLGLIKRHRRGGAIRYDLVQRTPDGLKVYYGVTEDGMHGPWAEFITQEPVPEDDAG